MLVCFWCFCDYWVLLFLQLLNLSGVSRVRPPCESMFPGGLLYSHKPFPHTSQPTAILYLQNPQSLRSVGCIFVYVQLLLLLDVLSVDATRWACRRNAAYGRAWPLAPPPPFPALIANVAQRELRREEHPLEFEFD